jgi:hypothetical protein
MSGFIAPAPDFIIMKYLTRIIRHRRFWQFACLLGADSLIFGTTNPDTARSFILIVGFLLFSVSVCYVLYGLLTLPGLYGLPIQHKRRLLVTLTSLSASLAALQSIGQLNPRDILVLSALTLLLYMYASRAKSMRQQHAQAV